MTEAKLHEAHKKYETLYGKLQVAQAQMGLDNDENAQALMVRVSFWALKSLTCLNVFP